MNPIEHLLIALVPVGLYVYLRDWQLPSRELTAVTFIGSQFPDLIDKPLAVQLNIIPTGRVFMHSLPFAILVWFVAIVYGWKTSRLRGGVAFVFAYASHVVADNYKFLFTGQIPNDLLWPFRPPIPRPSVPRWAGPSSINIHLYTLFSVVVLTVTVYRLQQDIRQLRNDTDTS